MKLRTTCLKYVPVMAAILIFLLTAGCDAPGKSLSRDGQEKWSIKVPAGVKLPGLPESVSDALDALGFKKPDQTLAVPVEITYERRDQSAEAQTPSNPTEPASTETGNKGTAASSGAGEGIDQALASVAFLPWVGAGLIVLGVASIFLKQWIGVLPKGVSWGLIATGVGFCAFPIFIDRVLSQFNVNVVIVILVIVGVGFGIAYLVGAFDNRKTALKTQPPGDTK